MTALSKYLSKLFDICFRCNVAVWAMSQGLKSGIFFKPAWVLAFLEEPICFGTCTSHICLCTITKSDVKKVATISFRLFRIIHCREQGHCLSFCPWRCKTKFQLSLNRLGEAWRWVVPDMHSNLLIRSFSNNHMRMLGPTDAAWFACQRGVGIISWFSLLGGWGCDDSNVLAGTTPNTQTF